MVYVDLYLIFTWLISASTHNCSPRWKLDHHQQGIGTELRNYQVLVETQLFPHVIHLFFRGSIIPVQHVFQCSATANHFISVDMSPWNICIQLLGLKDWLLAYIRSAGLCSSAWLPQCTLSASIPSHPMDGILFWWQNYYFSFLVEVETIVDWRAKTKWNWWLTSSRDERKGFWWLSWPRAQFFSHMITLVVLVFFVSHSQRQISLMWQLVS